MHILVKNTMFLKNKSIKRKKKKKKKKKRNITDTKTKNISKTKRPNRNPFLTHPVRFS